MKKKISILVLCLITAVSMLGLTGCDSNDPYGSIDLSQHIKVGKYKGLKVEKVTVKVKKKDIADAVNQALEAAKKNEDLDEGTKVKSGDTVNIDYVGKVDGKKFDGGSAEGYDLVIGSGSFIDGFEDGLIGKKVGQSKIKLHLAFPPTYQEKSLQGKDVVFAVKINSAKRSVTPEYNNDFAKSQGDYKTTKQYEKALKKQIYKQKKNQAVAAQQSDLLSQVLKKTKVKKYPSEMVDKYVEVINTQIKSYAQQYSTDEKTIMAQMFGVTTKKELKGIAKNYVKEEMTVAYIAEQEDLKYTDEEAEKLREQLENYGYDEKSIEEVTGRTMDECVHTELIRQKVLEFLYDNAKIK